MNKRLAGLLIEGNCTASTLLRLPGISAELGPIKSSGLQVARRVSNFLKAGYAVTSYDELADARTILARVPDKSIDRVVREIYQIGSDWTDHSFVLCETWAPTDHLEPLRSLGATVASLVALPSGRQPTFVVEGDLMAVRHARRMIERADARTIELRSGTKHLYFAAALLCTAIPVPVLLMAQQLLRDCGVSGNQLSGAIEEMSEETLASFLKGARMTWGGPLADSLRSPHGPYWDSLAQTHPELSITLRELVKMGRSYMGQKLSRVQGA